MWPLPAGAGRAAAPEQEGSLSWQTSNSRHNPIERIVILKFGRNLVWSKAKAKTSSVGAKQQHFVFLQPWLEAAAMEGCSTAEQPVEFRGPAEQHPGANPEPGGLRNQTPAGLQESKGSRTWPKAKTPLTECKKVLLTATGLELRKVLFTFTHNDEL